MKLSATKMRFDELEAGELYVLTLADGAVLYTRIPGDPLDGDPIVYRIELTT